MEATLFKASKKFSKNLSGMGYALSLTASLIFALSGCAGEKFFDQLTTTSASSLSGYIIISSSNNAGGTAGSAGTVAMYDGSGNFVRSLRDYYDTIEVPTGLAYIGSNNLLIAVDGTDRIELSNILTSAYTTYPVATGITAAPLKQMTTDSSYNVYVSEFAGNTIEKIDTTGTRVGNPFITGGGSCVVSSPWGIAYVPTTNRLVVASNVAANLNFFDATTGLCATSVNNAAYTAQSPTAVVYHTLYNKLLIARIGDDRIYAANADGSSPVIAYSNVARIGDPYSMAVDTSGYVYVGSAVQDTIEKLSFNGTTLTHVSSGPLIGPNIYTQNPTQILVLP
jgi:hypothetical protein